jgi:methyl-accepting chemotaxis protein
MTDPQKPDIKDASTPDLFDKITDESTFLGRLANKIPGFSGYVERSRRREADQMLRETIAKQIEAARVRLSAVHQELSRDIIKAMDYAEPLGEIDTRLMGLANKIKDAPQGYAGFFDAVKVDEEDLARVYAFDAGMMDFVDQIDEDVVSLEQAIAEDDDIAGSVRQLNRTAMEANEAFGSRNEVLKGIS